MIPMGMQEACVAIIGKEIGANNVKQAKSYTKVMSTIAVFVLGLQACLLWFFRYQVTGLFTQEPAVFAITVVVLKIIAIVTITDGG